MKFWGDMNCDPCKRSVNSFPDPAWMPVLAGRNFHVENNRLLVYYQLSKELVALTVTASIQGVV